MRAFFASGLSSHFPSGGARLLAVDSERELRDPRELLDGFGATLHLVEEAEPSRTSARRCGTSHSFSTCERVLD